MAQFATGPDDKVDSSKYFESQGLTKREYFAAMAMQGYISAGSAGMPSFEDIASMAVQTADYLIKELNVVEIDTI